MANKKLLASDGSGSFTEISSSGLYYDDAANKLIAPAISASSISASFNDGLVNISTRNTLAGAAISAGTSGSLLQYTGTGYATVLPKTLGGDLSGSTDGIVKVLRVGSVSSGSLPYSAGGSGLADNGLFYKDINGNLTVLTGSGDDYLIKINESGFEVTSQDPTVDYDSRIDVYTTTGSTITWTKKGNPRFIKVLVMGGGGGGGSGYRTISNGLSDTQGGGGGGAGGASIFTLDAANISSASIIIGSGGLGATTTIGGGNSNGRAGGDGSPTTFITNTGYVIESTGGRGGVGGQEINRGAAASGGGGNLPAVPGGQPGNGWPGTANATPGANGLFRSGGGAGGGVGQSSPTPNATTFGSNSGICYTFDINNANKYARGFGGQVNMINNGTNPPTYFSNGGIPISYATGSLVALTGSFRGISNDPFLTSGYYLNGTQSNTPLYFHGGGGGGTHAQASTLAGIRNGRYGFGSPANDPATGVAYASGGGGGGGIRIPTTTSVSAVSTNGGDGGQGIVIIWSY
jgi:hypothetical protein